MTYRGRVENGMVILESRPGLPDGTIVFVRTEKKVKRRRVRSGPKAATLYEQLKSVIGKARGLPTDASVNLDHYLYRLPKRT